MLKIISAVVLTMIEIVSVYTFSFTSADGSTINVSSFEGKKILIVNTASASSHAGQYAELEQLYQQYKDSLVVIVFPSNDFNNEPGSSLSISDSIHSRYDAHYIIAEKTKVITDSNGTAHPIFQWLASQEQNGMIAAAPKGDFYKVLLGPDGKPVGVFSGSVSPVSDVIKQAVETYTGP
jgi:glutathione peroxidase